jgi:hypothetical protein
VDHSRREEYGIDAIQAAAVRGVLSLRRDAETTGRESESRRRSHG